MEWCNNNYLPYTASMNLLRIWWNMKTLWRYYWLGRTEEPLFIIQYSNLMALEATFSLCSIKHHTMNTRGESVSTMPRILTSNWTEVNGQFHAPVALHPGKQPRYHVAPKAVVKRKILVPATAYSSWWWAIPFRGRENITWTNMVIYLAVSNTLLHPFQVSVTI